MDILAVRACQNPKPDGQDCFNGQDAVNNKLLGSIVLARSKLRVLYKMLHQPFTTGLYGLHCSPF